MKFKDTLSNFVALSFLIVFVFPVKPAQAASSEGSCSYLSEDFSGTSGNSWASDSYGTWTYKNGKLNVTNITSGKISHAGTSFSPSNYFSVDSDAEVVSLAQSNGAYGMYVYTTGTTYISANGKTFDGAAAFVFSDHISLSGWDVNANTWSEIARYTPTGTISSIGLGFSSGAITLRINKQDTTAKLSISIPAPSIFNKVWLLAQGSSGFATKGTEMNFDNVCAGPLGSSGTGTCTATMDSNFNIHIPAIKYIDPLLGNIYLWADLRYRIDPSRILFQLSDYGQITNASSYQCVMSMLGSDATIHINDLFVNSMSLWANLKYDFSSSTGSNIYFYASNWGTNTGSGTANIVTPLSPADGSSVQSLTPSLSWSATGSPASYRVFIAADENTLKGLNSDAGSCSNCILTTHIDTATSYTIPSGTLSSGTTYYWMVKSSYNVLSSIWSFKTASSGIGGGTGGGGGGSSGSSGITTGAATTLATQQVNTSGGAIIINKPNDPLNGLELDIPSGSYTNSRQFTISSSQVTTHTFGANFNPISPLITVDNGGGYSNEIMSVKIPVKIPSGHFAMGFIYDDQTGRLEGLPTVAQDTNSITIATRHFSKQTTSRVSQGLGRLSFIISSIDATLLNKDIDTLFRPGIDDWQFTNYGSYIAPGGHCAGQSMGALWYFYEQPDGANLTLYGRYDNNGDQPPTSGLWQDDSLGYRFSSVLQKSSDWDGLARKFTKQIVTLYDTNTWRLFAYSMLLTGQPQMTEIWNTTIGGGHAMVVYRIFQGKLYVSDPNYPADTGRGIEYSNGKFTPYNSGANATDIANGNGKAYDLIAYLAVTAVIDWDNIGTHWTELKGKTIGNNYFPSYKIIYIDDKNQSHDLVDGYESSKKLIYITSTSNDATTTISIYRDGNWLSFDAAGNIELNPGNNRLGIYIQGSVNGNWQYIDFKYINVKFSAPVITSISPDSGKVGDTVTITGTGFGATQDTSTVKFVGTTATVVSWSDTSIVVKVPNITSTGDVIVNVGGTDSNGVKFTILNKCSTQQVAGADTPETRVIDLGTNHGAFKFDWETYTQKDRITVSYEGKTLFDSGCVGANGTQNLSYSGTSTFVTVTVQPNCAGGSGTAWNFTVYCPQ